MRETRTNTEAAGRATDGRPAAAHAGAADDVAPLLAGFAAVAGSVRTLLELRAERRKLAVRRFAERAALALLLAALAGPLALAGVAWFVVGVSQALHVVFEGRPWLANMATGALILAFLCGTWLVARARLRRAWLREQRARQTASVKENGQ